MATYYPSENPSSTGYGQMRLKVEVLSQDVENVTSTVNVTLQALPDALAYRYNAVGTITIDGTVYSSFSETPVLYLTGWNDAWSATKTISHGADGTKSFTLKIEKNSTVYTAGFTLWQNYGGTYYSIYFPDSTYTIALPTIDNGSKVHIDNGTALAEYYIYIDNGSSWDKYDAYIDNGSSWVKI